MTVRLPLFLLIALFIVAAGTLPRWASVIVDASMESRNIHEAPPMRLYEAYPFTALTKQWSASEGIKVYFDDQRRILRAMQATEPPTGDKQFTLAAMGDLMRMPAQQQHSISPATLQFLSQFDLITANLETLISPRYSLPPDSLFMMNSTPEILNGFRDDNGRNLLSIVSLANNHIVDYPDDAIEDTFEALNQQAIAYHGIHRPGNHPSFATLERSGIRVGYFAATSFVNNPAKLESSHMQLTPMLEGVASVPFARLKTFEDIDLAPFRKVLSDMEAANVDLKVISLHWGREHVMYPDAVQIDIAHALVAAGADIIIGAHTHVPQPAEICFINGYEQSLGSELSTLIDARGCKLTAEGALRKGIIFYSLGNFRGYSASFWQQLGTIAQLQIARQGDVTDWQFKGFTFTQDQQVAPPNGPRQLMLLDEYIHDFCLQHRCPLAQNALASQAERHLSGSSLCSLEEAWIACLSLIDSAGRLLGIFW